MPAFVGLVNCSTIDALAPGAIPLNQLMNGLPAGVAQEVVPVAPYKAALLLRLSHTSTVKKPRPEPASVPDHCTGNVADDSVGGSGRTRVTGGSRSTVLSQIGVAMGAFVSKTTSAWFRIAVPVASPLLGITVK